MKILIDESLPRYLKSMLENHEADTVQEMGWAGFKNGDLVALAEADYDVFLTADKNLRYQQNMQGRRLALIIFPTNKLSVIKELAEALNQVIDTINTGDFVELDAPNSD